MIQTKLLILNAYPITNFHLDLIRKVRLIRDKEEQKLLVVFLHDKSQPLVLGPAEKQIELASQIIESLNFSDVEVLNFRASWSVADYYLNYNSNIVFYDEDDSFLEKAINLSRLMLPNLMFSSVTLHYPLSLETINSAQALELTHMRADLSPYVSGAVKQLLEEQVAGQCKLAITGEIGVGKSYVTKALYQLLSQETAVRVIKINDLLRQIYSESLPGSKRVQEKIAEHAGPAMLNERGNVNLTMLFQKIFGLDTENTDQKFQHLDWLVQLTLPLLISKYRQALHNFQGLVLVEFGYLAELNMGSWTNYNVVVIESPNQEEFLQEQGLNKKDLNAMPILNWSGDIKLRMLKGQAEKVGLSERFLRSYTNEKNLATRPIHLDGMKSLSEDIIKYFGII